jgi:hypothetical protein
MAGSSGSTAQCSADQRWLAIKQSRPAYASSTVEHHPDEIRRHMLSFTGHAQ